MNNKRLMLGVLAGAAAGAIAGILMAPDKGSVTRDNIAKRGRDTVDSLKGQVNDLVDKVADNYFSGNESTGSGSMSSERSERGRSGSDRNSSGSPTRSFS